jgi:hypothetical protein
MSDALDSLKLIRSINSLESDHIYSDYKQSSGNLALPLISSVLLGLATTIISILISYLCESLTGYSFQSFFLWFIFPIGALILGMCSSFGVYIVAKKLGKTLIYHYFLGVIFSFLAIVGAYYFSFFSCYLDENMKENHLFQGSHISNFIHKETEQPIDFKSYMKMSVENRSDSIFLAVGSKNIKIPIPP